MFELKRSLVSRPAGRVRTSHGRFKTMLSASAVGLGVFSASGALAQQASDAAGISPVSVTADAYSLAPNSSAPRQAAGAADTSSIITLASGPLKAASADGSKKLVLAQNTTPGAPAAASAAPVDQTYAGFDAKLGTNPFVRFYNYQKLELGLSSAPVAPT